MSTLKTITIRKMKNKKWPLLIASSALLLIGGCSSSGSDDTEVEFSHIHGLGFTEDGGKAYVPAHDGLRVYQDGEWSNPDMDRHDYMGFSMVDDGFYSSGHPDLSTDLENPLGIVKSTDEGKTIETLDLYKEVDLHGMDVGYKSHAIYVFNPEPNSRMDDIGLYYSTDETKTWNKSNMAGVQEEVTALAVHPTEEDTLAVGSENGIYLSQDYGQTFETLPPDINVSAISFSHNGDLLIGGIGSEVQFIKMNIETENTEEINIPELNTENFITYIAENPQNEKAIMMTTEEKDIYYTKDLGESWEKTAEKGYAQSVE